MRDREPAIGRKVLRRQAFFERLETRRILANDLGLSSSSLDDMQGDHSSPSSIQSTDTFANAITSSVYLNREGASFPLKILPSRWVLKTSQIDTQLRLDAFPSTPKLERTLQAGFGVYEVSDALSHVLTERNASRDNASLVSPVFVDPSTGTELAVLDEVIVALRPHVEPDAFFAGHDEFASHTKLIGTTDQYVTKLASGLGMATIQASNKLSADRSVAWSQPNFYQSLTRASYVPNDPRFINQWHLNNTGQAGGLVDADSDLPEAWGINPGLTSNIVIAIVDDGVPTNHPDLQNWVNRGEIAGDGIDNDLNGWIDDVHGWNFVSNNNFSGPTSTTDRHGTSVAGVAAAIGENGIGVTGAAYRSPVMGIRIFEGNSVASDAAIASAIYYAAGRTADGLGTWKAGDVVNHSWGGGAPSVAIASALQWATTQGRQGKGATNFFASGNGFSSFLSYPSSLTATLPGVIAVGATNNLGQRSNYSNYGAALDFVTPSNDTRSGYLAIDTTDRVGADGYANGDYTGTGGSGFGGTSSATPLATGIGALTLAQAEALGLSLSPAQLRSYLRNATDLSGDVLYDPITGKNIEFGFGRLNAYAAVSGIGKAEISVISQSRELIDGISSVDFGELQTSQFRDVTFRVRNQGTQTLNLLGLAIVPGAFTLVSGLGDVVLELGESTSFTVRFAPSGEGNHATTLSLQSNDSNESIFSFQLYGAARTPALMGTVFEDWDGDGNRDANDPGQAGLVVYLDQNNNGDRDIQSSNAITSTSTTLPDLTTVTSPLDVTSSVTNGTLVDVNVRVSLSHTYVGDLTLQLVHPDGTKILLMDQRGGSGQNIVGLIVDDEANSLIAQGLAPFTGSFRPENALSTLDGKTAEGTWVLEVIDSVGGDSGVLNSWGLELSISEELGVSTDSNGVYTFATLPVGITHNVRVDFQTTSIVMTAPLTAVQSIFLPNGNTTMTADFGYAVTQRSYIRVFHDIDGDGTIDPFENGEPNRLVFLDNNRDGTQSPVAVNRANNTAMALPDLATRRSTINVTSLSPLHSILDLNVRVTIAHTFTSDLAAWIIDPRGRRVLLFAGVGGSGSNFTGTVFDDEASTGISSGTPPFTGSFRPVEPLSVFDGMLASGLWTLEITDFFTPDPGTLNSWEIQFAIGDMTTITDRFGNASFNLPNGTHTLKLQSQPGWVYTLPGNGVVQSTVSGSPRFEQPIGTQRIQGSIESRYVFYANSIFDSSGDAAAAIDPSRQALLPGQTASAVNHTSFERGLNGIIVDMSGSLGPDTSDFQFATWDGFDPAGFVGVVSLRTISILPGVGGQGTYRVKVEFPDGAIRNTWLRVTVLATPNNGLAGNDVFYFGNSVGDVGVGNTGSPVVVRVNASDTSSIRQNQSIAPGSALVSNIFDLNKDGRVNAIDTSIARQNQASAILQYFTAPASVALASVLSDPDVLRSTPSVNYLAEWKESPLHGTHLLDALMTQLCLEPKLEALLALNFAVDEELSDPIDENVVDEGDLAWENTQEVDVVLQEVFEDFYAVAILDK